MPKGARPHRFKSASRSDTVAQILGNVAYVSVAPAGFATTAIPILHCRLGELDVNPPDVTLPQLSPIRE